MNAPTDRRGFPVRLFLPDGDPTGLKVIEKSLLALERETEGLLEEIVGGGAR